MKGLKYMLLILLVLTSKSLISQVMDTCQTNETAVYHILNKNMATQLVFQVENAEILSENPTNSDSVMLQWKDETGIFELSVYETTNSGCTGEMYIAQIMVIEPINNVIELVIPNVFTPNEDGINDYFVINPINSLSNYRISIYTRTGIKVFESHQINNSWDGRSKGQPSYPGVYYYVISYQIGSGPVDVKGFLHLIR